jgi:putative transposase
LRELPEQIADEHGWQIVANETMLDHMHLFVRVGATDAHPLVYLAVLSAAVACPARRRRG